MKSPRFSRILPQILALICLMFAVACTPPEEDPVAVFECQADEEPDFLEIMGCQGDFEYLASNPINASLPDSRAVKTVLDRDDPEGPQLYYQNSKRYLFHYDFCFEHLSVAAGLPPVPATIGEFNATEYTSPNRRFVLGILLYHGNQDVWTWEVEPNDNASAELITQAYDAIVANSFIGDALFFHPSSQISEAIVPDLPPHVKVMTTAELMKGITYQPLNLGVSLGRLRVMSTAQLETEYVDFQDIVVLDQVPNDISVVLGIITAQFQTPLSHINVLSQNRGTPNMALLEANTNPDIVALDGKWVRLEVTPFEYSLTEATAAEAADWWEQHKPPALGDPAKDLSVTDLRDTDDMIVGVENLEAQFDVLIPAFGGKAGHYGGLSKVPGVESPEAFGIPIYYYDQFLVENGFDVRIAQMLADPVFNDDIAYRDEQLKLLRDDMKLAPINQDFLDMLTEKLNTEFPNTRMRFRSSTNAEDLEGFTGAGLYTSKSGQPGDLVDPIEDAIRTVWSSVWYFRAFEERRYNGIGHEAVGMALLVHNSFPDEEANGVALTGNPYDTSEDGALPGFYVNVQEGEASVVQPDPGVTTDQYIHFFTQEGRPIVFLNHSNQVPAGETVLTAAEMNQLGEALNAIHLYFAPAYGPDKPGDWYAMDVEFKFDAPAGETPKLFVKQARPHPGWNN
jgi:hypothetical protein